MSQVESHMKIICVILQNSGLNAWFLIDILLSFAKLSTAIKMQPVTINDIITSLLKVILILVSKINLSFASLKKKKKSPIGGNGKRIRLVSFIDFQNSSRSADNHYKKTARIISPRFREICCGFSWLSEADL